MIHVEYLQYEFEDHRKQGGYSYQKNNSSDDSYEDDPPGLIRKYHIKSTLLYYKF